MPKRSSLGGADIHYSSSLVGDMSGPAPYVHRGGGGGGGGAVGGGHGPPALLLGRSLDFSRAGAGAAAVADRPPTATGSSRILQPSARDDVQSAATGNGAAEEPPSASASPVRALLRSAADKLWQHLLFHRADGASGAGGGSEDGAGHEPPEDWDGGGGKGRTEEVEFEQWLSTLDTLADSEIASPEKQPAVAAKAEAAAGWAGRVAGTGQGPPSAEDAASDFESESVRGPTPSMARDSPRQFFKQAWELPSENGEARPAMAWQI